MVRDQPYLSFTEFDIAMMSLAIEKAKIAMEVEEVPVGAIICKDKEIIASGYNCCISLNDPTAHAEIIALRSCAQKLQNYRLTGTTLYTTLEPCIMCLGAISNARISKVIISTLEPKTGVIFSNPIKYNLVYSKIIWEHGLLSSESSKILKTFFKNKR